MNGATHRGEPTVPTKKTTERGRIHLGLDVAKNSIAVAILRPDEVEPDTEKIGHDEASIRRLIARLGDPWDLFACYEAGPTGYDLSRLLTSIGVRTDVVAPSLIPKAPGDRARRGRDPRPLPRPPGRRRGPTPCSSASRLVPASPQRDLPRADDLDREARGVDRTSPLRRRSDQERLLLLPRGSR